MSAYDPKRTSAALVVQVRLFAVTAAARTGADLAAAGAQSTAWSCGFRVSGRRLDMGTRWRRYLFCPSSSRCICLTMAQHGLATPKAQDKESYRLKPACWKGGG